MDSESEVAPVAEPAHIGMGCLVGCLVSGRETAASERQVRSEADTSSMLVQRLDEKQKVADTLDWSSM